MNALVLKGSGGACFDLDVVRKLCGIPSSGGRAKPKMPQLGSGGHAAVLIIEDAGSLAMAAPVSEQIATIKSAFGLSISQLAHVLNVQRPTIYSWMDSEAPAPQLRSSNRDRIDSLLDIATIWNSQIRLPAMSFADRAKVGEHDLLSLLSQEHLDRDAIDQLLRALAELANLEIQRQQAEPTAYARLKAQGFAELPSRAQRRRAR